MATVKLALQRAGKASAYVQATHSKMPKTVLAEHNCPSCGTHVHANYMTNTFCPNCGTVMEANVEAGLHEVHNNSVEASLQDALVVELGECPSCGTHHVGHASLANVDKMHCIVCSAEMDIEAGEDAGLEDDTSEMPEDEMSEGSEDDTSEMPEDEMIVENEYNGEDEMSEEPEDGMSEESEDMESEDESEESEDESEEGMSENDGSEFTDEALAYNSKGSGYIKHQIARQVKRDYHRKLNSMKLNELRKELKKKQDRLKELQDQGATPYDTRYIREDITTLKSYIEHYKFTASMKSDFKDSLPRKPKSMMRNRGRTPINERSRDSYVRSLHSKELSELKAELKKQKANLEELLAKKTSLKTIQAKEKLAPRINRLKNKIRVIEMNINILRTGRAVASMEGVEDFTVSYGDDVNDTVIESGDALAPTEEQLADAESEGNVVDTVAQPTMSIAKTNTNTKVKVNLMQRHMPDVTAGNAKIGFIHNKATNTWLLTAGNVHIATSVQEKVAAHLSKYYLTDSYAQAFAVAIKNNGITAEVEKNFGLEPVVVEVPVTEVAKELVTKTEETLRDEHNQAVASLNDHYRQCFDLALIQLGKGMAGRRNPLRDNLITSLAAIGVPDAQTLVDKVIANHGDAFANAVLARTDELRLKSTEALNEIATVTASAGYKPFEIDESATFAQSLVSAGKFAVHSNSVTASITPENNNVPKKRPNIFGGRR